MPPNVAQGTYDLVLTVDSTYTLKAYSQLMFATMFDTVDALSETKKRFAYGYLQLRMSACFRLQRMRAT